MESPPQKQTQWWRRAASRRRRWWLQFSAVVERKDRSFRGNVMQKTLILLCPRLKSPQQSWTVKNDRSKTDPRLLLLPSTMPLYHQTTEGSRLACLVVQ